MTANVVRGSGSLKWKKNYFAKDPAPAPQAETRDPVESSNATSEETANAAHADLPYKSVSFEEMAELCNNSDGHCGQYVFVDARSKEAYEEGHIKGAIRCDPYDVHESIDCILEKAQNAEKIIVYCNGYDCEDSAYTCRELLAAGLPCEAIHIYPGGWTEWEENGMPVCKADETP
jgi:3-mercaptopyruvate sulfurtransferase SseA